MECACSLGPRPRSPPITKPEKATLYTETGGLASSPGTRVYEESLRAEISARERAETDRRLLLAHVLEDAPAERFV
jgi:hypothetical protein